MLEEEMKKHFFLTAVAFIALLTIFASHQRAPDVKPVKKDILPSEAMVKPDLNFGKFPLYFVFNKGQVDKRAKFYAKASRYTLWLTKEGLVFDSFKKIEDMDKVRDRSRHSIHSTHPLKTERDVSRLLFVNANKNPEMVALEETRLRVNYFNGNDRSKWQGNIPTSQAVLYKDLYKNIDLKVYGIEKQIEYDWIVKPGGNPGDIRFEYKNVKGTRVDDKGNLLIETGFGELMHKRPDCYQLIGSDRRYVETKFKKNGKNIYGFEVEEYDKQYELIIDPVVLAYSTYLGGEGDEHYEFGIAVDTIGNAYVTGNTTSTNFPTQNQYQAYQGDRDVFVTKIDTTQNGASSLIYSTYLGGEGHDEGRGIAVDSSGNAYVTGFTESTDFPTLNQYQADQPDKDAFVAKIDTNQNGSSSLIYSTYLGGKSFDYGEGIAVDINGYTYVGGWTASTDFPILNQYQTFQGFYYNAFVTKLDTNQDGASSLIYSTYLGGGSEYCYGIAVDSIENAYVVGYTLSPNFPIRNQYQSVQSQWDTFVTRIDTTQAGDPSLIYSTYLGGDENDFCWGVAVDSSGIVCVSGATYSTDFPTLNQYQDEPGDDDADAYVAKIDTTKSGASSLIYSTYLGGGGKDHSRGIALDSSGNVYVTGDTESTNFPVLNQYQTYQGIGDVFVTKIDPTQSGASSLIYSTYLGGRAYERGCGVAVDNHGNAYVTGYTGSINFPILNQYQTHQAYSDAFVTKLFYANPPTVTTAPISFITTTSAESGGEVTSDGGASVTARGVCWSTSPNPTLQDYYTTDGTGTGVFTSSMTGLTPNTVYYIRAYATNAAGTAYGHEEIFESDEPYIEVTYPDGGEAWEVGSSQTITWTSKYVQGNVKIEYSTNHGDSWTTISDSTGNDGSFPWVVPNAPSDQCLIRISEIDSGPSDISNGFFTIFQPSITVISPNGGEIWEVGSKKNITWNSIGTVGNVKIEYSTDNGGQWIVVTGTTPNDGSYTWTVPGVVSNQCLVQISETDGSPIDKSDRVFSIVESSSVTVISPNGGETLYVGVPETITWTSFGNVGNVKIQYSTNGGGQWTDIIASTENDGSFPWTVPNTPSAECLMRVAGTGGEPSDTSDNLFSIQTPPTITVTSPNGGENLTVGSNHSITWTSEGVQGNVTIEYSINKGKTWQIINRSTANDGSYNWTVPGRISDNCLVRISGSNRDGIASDTSDSVFSVVPLSDAVLTVTSPNGGEQLTPGTIHDIKWTSTYPDQLNYVAIEYSTDRGASWTTIVGSVNNAANGSFSWTVPNTPSVDCTVRIRGADKDDDPSDTSDGMFTILPLSSPSLTVTSPNGGETWLQDSQQTITWETNGSVGYVKIEYSIDGGNAWTVITASTANSGSYNWTVPSISSTNCLVRVSDADSGGPPSDVSDSPFSILPHPSITVTSPNGGEQWAAGTSNKISWTGTGLVGEVKIEYSIDGGGNWTVITHSTLFDGDFDWIVPDTPSNECLIRVTATDTDPVNPISDVSDNVFSITDALQPALTVTSPNGGEDLFVGSIHNVTWTTSGSVGNVAIDYSINGGQTWTEIVGSTENDGDHDWLVPDNPSTNCLVRVLETDGSPLDISDAVFSILSPPQGTITVTSPNGSETWFVGSSQEIKWTGTGTINNVAIFLSTDNGTNWTLIVPSTENDGSHNWTVPDTPSVNCLVRVSAKAGDWDGGPADTSDSVFTIFESSPAAAIRVDFPNGGETWEVGSNQQISWTSNGNLEEVIVEYSTDHSATWTTILQSAANNGSYNWQVPDTPSTACLVRVSATDADSDTTVADVSDDLFSIVPPADPTITVKTPNGGEHLYIGYAYDITWTSTGLDENAEVTIDYTTNGGNSWTEIIAATPDDGSFQWNVPNQPSGNCLVRIRETDGAPVDVSDAVFAIDFPPSATVEVLTPNGGENLDAGSQFDITWTGSGLNTVDIEFTADNGSTWSFIATVPADDGIYNWTVPEISSDNCLVRVTGGGSRDNPSDVSDGVFSISQPVQPVVEVTSPNGGESLGVGGQFNITWLSTGIQTVKIEYSIDNGDNWEVIDSVPAVGQRYYWTVPDTPSTMCLVRVSGDDGGANPSDVSDAVFSIVSN
jgi:hypothetical protein